MSEWPPKRSERIYGFAHDGDILLVGDYFVESFLGYLDAKAANDGQPQCTQVTVVTRQQWLVGNGQQASAEQ